MKWKTAISHVNDGQEIIRGYKLHDLVEKKSFVEVIYLILLGNLPNPSETRMLNAILTMMIDHGVGVASTMSARLVSSLGNQPHVAVAAGILGLGGAAHGGALGAAASLLESTIATSDGNIEELVMEFKKQKLRIPGFGHRVLKHDHRADTLFDIARETGFFGRHCQLAVAIGEELNKISSKPLPLNMDGANAAILLDMGFAPPLIRNLFLIGRLPGLIAHVQEEMTSGEGVRRLEEEEIEYSGESDKSI